MDILGCVDYTQCGLHTKTSFIKLGFKFNKFGMALNHF